MLLELRRGPVATRIEIESGFAEDREGRPRRAWSRQTLGAQPVESFYEFQADGVVVRHRQGGQSAERSEKLPWPEGEWLTPGQARRRAREMAAAGARQFSLRLIDPSLGLEPVTLDWVLESAEQEVLTGRGTFRAARWRQTSSFTPQIHSTVFVDESGLVVRSSTSLMGLEMTQVLSTEEDVKGGSAPAPEILLRSFVRPDRRIERPRRTQRVIYELSLSDGGVPELPTVGAQRVEPVAGALRVTVDVDSSPRLEDVDPDAFLRATVFLPHDDPAIRQLLRQALAPEQQDPALPPERQALARAAALRDFVAGYLVQKDLGTVLGTATEVAASRSGDCTEHSVLLAALLRAAGVPARVVSGLVFVESFAGEADIFGYHMWTQALVDGRWIDLDATLPPDRPAPGSPDAPVLFDAAHIAVGTTSLDRDASALQEMARVLPLLGRLRIRVLEVDHR